jgi:hypothetical protein
MVFLLLIHRNLRVSYMQCNSCIRRSVNRHTPSPYSTQWRKIRNVADLMYREGKDNWSRDWSSVTASLPGPSPRGRSSWSWTRWRVQAARWLAHQQLHTASRRSCPRRQPACNRFVRSTVSQSKQSWKHFATVKYFQWGTWKVQRAYEIFF